MKLLDKKEIDKLIEGARQVGLPDEDIEDLVLGAEQVVIENEEE